MQKRVFRLVHENARNGAAQCCRTSPDGWLATFSEPTRTLEQNALFHAICSDFARSPMEWAGKRRNAAQWKVLLVSGHSAATKSGSEMVPGLEGEFVNLRESTASMSKSRGASLIEYCIAFAALNGVPLNDFRQLSE